MEERIRRRGVEGGGERGHPWRETGGSCADELSKRNEQLLGGPDRGLWA